MDPGTRHPLAALGAADEPVAVVRDGDGWRVAWEAEAVLEGPGPEVLRSIDGLTPGLWAGFLAFEFGHAVEQVRPGRASRAPRVVPDAVLVRFARHARVATLADLPATAPVRLGPARRTSLDRREHGAAVATVLDHIHAGDCYQVNLTRTIEWDAAGDPVAMFAALAARRPAPHATLLRLPTADGPVAVVGASPERFLARDGATVETRPIKAPLRQAAGAGDAVPRRRRRADHAAAERKIPSSVTCPGIAAWDLCAATKASITPRWNMRAVTFRPMRRKAISRC